MSSKEDLFQLFLDRVFKIGEILSPSDIRNMYLDKSILTIAEEDLSYIIDKYGKLLSSYYVDINKGLKCNDLNSDIISRIGEYSIHNLDINIVNANTAALDSISKKPTSTESLKEINSLILGKICAVCKIITSMKCKCGNIYYCGKICQKKNWKTHKLSCSVLLKIN